MTKNHRPICSACGAMPYRLLRSHIDNSLVCPVCALSSDPYLPARQREAIERQLAERRKHENSEEVSYA